MEQASQLSRVAHGGLSWTIGADRPFHLIGVQAYPFWEVTLPGSPGRDFGIPEKDTSLGTSLLVCRAVAAIK